MKPIDWTTDISMSNTATTDAVKIFLENAAELKGSDAQIDYAKDLRRRAFVQVYLFFRGVHHKRPEAFDQLFEKAQSALDILRTETSASKWVSGRVASFSCKKDVARFLKANMK